MFNLKHLIRSFVTIAAVVLLCVTAAPDAHANNKHSATASQATETSITLNSTQGNKQTQSKENQKPSQKSIFDADVLERPLSYFINSFSSDEDDDEDMLSYGNTIIITIKALLASLLSTII